MADAPAGSRLAIAEALTNLVWAPIEQGLKGISLSANWMWPCRNEGEDARLYQAVQAASDFAIELGVNIPTGKDSLSMTQKYGDKKVYAPGTVIISTVGEVTDFRKIVIPVLKNDPATEIVYVDFSFDKLKLGGSSFAQILNKVGKEVPDVRDSEYFARAFTAIQQLVDEGIVLAGHDISAGGMVTALLEMCFADNRLGLDIDFSFLAEKDMIKILFAENPGVLIQIADKDAKKVSALMDKGFGVTKLATTGGFLRAGNTTLISGVEDDKLQDALGVIEKICKSREQITASTTPMGGAGGVYVPYPIRVTVGGATVFVLEVSQFLKV